ncbi:MAG: choice-of-anchor B family protein [Saprospiraceae bacterium]
MKKLIKSLILLLIPMLLTAQAQEGTLLGHWTDSTLVGSSDYSNRFNEVWSVAVNGHEYGIIGSTKGTHFIDVTDPANLFEKAFVPGRVQGPVVVHRDYKTYKNYIYAVCDEGESSLQIIDYSFLPDSVSVVYNSDEVLRRAHNIFIDTMKAKLYALSYRAPNNLGGYGGMGVIDISDPIHPTLIGKFNNVGAFQFGHIHDAYVRNDTAYLNAGNDGFAVADFSDTENPVLLGTMTHYIGQGYDHSGWLSADGHYYFLADENHGKPLKTVDVSDFEDIKVVNTFDIGGLPQSIPHNQMIACNYLYVSYYYDGVQVFDISDPTDVKRVLYYDTSSWPYDNNYRGAWGVNPWLPSGNILVSDMQEGLFVIEGLGDNCFGPVSKTTSILKQKFDVSLAPQPATDKLQVNISGELSNQGTLIRVYDLNQKLILSQIVDSQNVELDIPTVLANGLYIAQIQQGSAIVSKKVLIQH